MQKICTYTHLFIGLTIQTDTGKFPIVAALDCRK